MEHVAGSHLCGEVSPWMNHSDWVPATNTYFLTPLILAVPFGLHLPLCGAMSDISVCSSPMCNAPTVPLGLQYDSYTFPYSTLGIPVL